MMESYQVGKLSSYFLPSYYLHVSRLRNLLFLSRTLSQTQNVCERGKHVHTV